MSELRNTVMRLTDDQAAARDEGLLEWADFTSIAALRVTATLLCSPREVIHRILENVSIEDGKVKRLVTFEYEAQQMPHFFPSVIAPKNDLLDTLSISSHPGVGEVTLTRLEAMTLSHRVLRGMLDRAIDDYQATSGAEPSAQELRLLDTLSTIVFSSDVRHSSLLRTLTRLRTEKIGAESALRGLRHVVAHEPTWRLIQLLHHYRAVYIPITALNAEKQEPRIRQKVQVELEHDLLDIVPPRRRLTLYFKREPLRFLIETTALGRSRSYHMRLRGRPDTFVSSSEVRSEASRFFRDGWRRPRPSELSIVAEEGLTVSPIERRIDNLLHQYVRCSHKYPALDSYRVRYFIQVRFVERPLGSLGSSLARLSLSLTVSVMVLFLFGGLTSKGAGVALGATALFALPALIGGFKSITANTGTLASIVSGSALLSAFLCGLIYVYWIATMPLADPLHPAVTSDSRDAGSVGIYLVLITSSAIVGVIAVFQLLLDLSLFARQSLRIVRGSRS